MQMEVKILLHTNFLFIPLQLKIDIFSEINRLINFKYEMIILKASIDELKSLYKSASIYRKKQIEFVLKQTEKIKIVDYTDEDGTVDELILKFASTHSNVIVATNDQNLRRKLRKKHVPVIYVRQKKTLGLDGEIPL